MAEKSVAIVDDEPNVTAALANHLLIEGVETHQFNSAFDAIAAHHEKFFPVIITDIRMPGMSGIDFLREVKKIHPTCIVYIMTGYASMSGLIECLELGAADYFTKPFEDLNEVLRTVQTALLRYERWRKDLVKLGRTHT